MQREFTKENAAAARRFVRCWQGMLNRPHTYNRRYVDELVARAYRAVNLPPPRYVFFCTSPMTMAWSHAVGRHVLGDEIGPCVRADVFAQPQMNAVRAVIGRMSKEAVRCLFSAVRKPIFAMTRPRACDEEKFLRMNNGRIPLSAEYPASISENVYASLIDGGIPQEWLPSDAKGPFDLDHIQWGQTSRHAPMLSFARRRLGLTAETEAAAPAIELLEEVYGLMPFSGACWVTAGPSYVNTKIEYELFSDGYISVYEGYEMWLRMHSPSRSSIH